MRRELAILLFVAVLTATGIAVAATVEDFKVDTAQDIIDLCTTPADDPSYIAAIHFCQGYLVGAYDYHVAANAGPEGDPLVCLPNPPPSRNEAIQMFIDWAKEHPEYMKEEAVEAEFRFLTEKWPCKK